MNSIVISAITENIVRFMVGLVKYVQVDTNHLKSGGAWIKNG